MEPSVRDCLNQIAALQDQLEELRLEKIAMAILLVRGAGGRIVISDLTALSLTHTSYIQEDRDPGTGDRIFTTFEVPKAPNMH